MCSKCEYSTKDSANFKRHIERKHSGLSRVPCQFCGEVFKDIKKHLQRTICGNNGVERVKVPCEQCDKLFSNRGKMREHLRKIHSGVRNETCSQCAYTTYSKYNMKLHIAKVHLGTGLIKNICPHCDKETSNIVYHLNTFHSEINNL